MTPRRAFWACGPLLAVAATLAALDAGPVTAQMAPMKPIPMTPGSGQAPATAAPSPAPASGPALQQMAPQPMTPGAVASAPMSQPMPSPGLGAGLSPGLGPSGPPAGGNPCIEEFTRLRGEAEKKAQLARAGSEKKVAREEMCKLVSALSTAETKWFTYTSKNAKRCGIPAQIVVQLRTGHDNLIKNRKALCSTAVAGGPAPPTLSEVLGTADLPTPSATSAKRGGTLDTLTGAPIR